MRNKNADDRRREAMRDDVWPGAGNVIWDPYDEEKTVGFATMPRLMPLIMVLVDELVGSGPIRIYWELWCRDRGQGIISIIDEQEHAHASGYGGERGLRTWQAHMRKLAESGFIKIAPKGNREFAHVLLLNPLAVAHWHHTRKRTPPGWWEAFRDRAREIKAKIPPPLDPTAPFPAPPDEDEDD